MWLSKDFDQYGWLFIPMLKHWVFWPDSYNKKKRKEVLGIVISSPDIRDVGKIVKFSPKQIEKIDVSKQVRKSKFLNPAHEEIMKVYNQFYSQGKSKRKR